MDSVGIGKGILKLIFLPGSIVRPCQGILELQINNGIVRYDPIDLESDESRKKYLSGLREFHSDVSESLICDIEGGMNALVSRLTNPAEGIRKDSDI